MAVAMEPHGRSNKSFGPTFRPNWGYTVGTFLSYYLWPWARYWLLLLRIVERKEEERRALYGKYETGGHLSEESAGIDRSQQKAGRYHSWLSRAREFGRCCGSGAYQVWRQVKVVIAILAEPAIMEQQREMVYDDIMNEWENALVEFQDTMTGLFDERT
jgi:hypothetical protein